MRKNKRLKVFVGLGVALLLAGFGALAGAETAGAGLSISEISMTRNLEGGVPQDTATSFGRAGEWIYCFMRVQNPARAETAVRVAFEPAEGEPARGTRGHRLTVPAQAQYRTVARTSANRDAGGYRCVVRTDEGDVLTHLDFQITE